MTPGNFSTVTAVPRRVCVVGAGYVGLTAATRVSHLGHRVRCVESDPRRLEQFQTDSIPIYESGLKEPVTAGRSQGGLEYFADEAPAIEDAKVALVCVGTPPQPSGEPDLGSMVQTARQLAAAATRDLVVVVTSTVPPGTCEALELVCAEDAAPGVLIRVASCPEFFRESRPVEAVMAPDRVVVGPDDPDVAETVANLYPAGSTVVNCDRPGQNWASTPPTHSWRPRSPSPTKWPACAKRSAPMPTACWPVLGWIAGSELRSCSPDPTTAVPAFPKTSPVFGPLGQALGVDTLLADAAEAENIQARPAVVDKLQLVVGPLDGKRVGVLGLAFKAGTDDTWDSPGLHIAQDLAEAEGDVRCFDPLASSDQALGTWTNDVDGTDADTVVVTTAADELATLEPAGLAAAMGGNVVVDAAGIFDLGACADTGLTVYGGGRGAPTDVHAIVWPPLRWAHPVAALAAR